MKDENLDEFSFVGKREEITDLLKPEAFKDKKFRAETIGKDGLTIPGTVLIFAEATIKVTKIDKKAKRAWGEHIKLVDQNVVSSHHEHNVDSSPEAFEEHGEPYCEDCQVGISEISTEDGERKNLDRQDNELEDGTIID